MKRLIQFSKEIVDGAATKEFGDEFDLDLKHAQGLTSDYTLCGIAFGEYVDYKHVVTGKITCPKCISEIAYCKSFKKSKHY